MHVLRVVINNINTKFASFKFIVAGCVYCIYKTQQERFEWNNGITSHCMQFNVLDNRTHTTPRVI